ncbi:hypothetical protein CYY_008862 [Polysphondylium violaceum]|uniref:Uncharacterized protein n=1 Tax=Polysphondylium violaceum TaxID=133409 RepID=A0A8J4V3I6_9MYCE|nr:hypothetical protein CYY_008862 [Polysphondylium violaceum]
MSSYYEAIEFKPSPKQQNILLQQEAIRKQRREERLNNSRDGASGSTPGGGAGITHTMNPRFGNLKSIPKLASKHSKYYTLKLRVTYDQSLLKPSDRLFKFFKDDLSVFVDEYDFRRPDYRLVFLKSFTLTRAVNEYPFPVLLTFSGLPETIESGSTHNVLLQSKTNNSDRPSDLIKGSKKKFKNQCPIPDPEFEIVQRPDSLLSYSTKRFVSEIPKEFCRCHEIGGGSSLSCTRDADLISKQYNVFDLFGFYISVARLGDNGDFKTHFTFPAKPNIISFDLEFKYYFLHYFNTNLEKAKNYNNRKNQNY